MNGAAEKCDAYDKIDSASNNLSLVFILIHIKFEFYLPDCFNFLMETIR